MAAAEERLSKMGDHIGKLGKSLGNSVEYYNKAVASLETRVMVKARSFRDLEVGTPEMEIEALEPVDLLPRRLQAPELAGGAEAELMRALEAHDEEEGENSKFEIRNPKEEEPE